ncbi:MAG: RNA 2',3'-cyclic phosphodiesterase [Acidobacteriaceae bacterium]|nr:RNA 2',3'-cyclic phosphodiesterase [Acidobacteriaceae bacterium]MBV9767248.1 RNA 2',3'-cyclic phosphodiesterase [Acidobacteriaceae bacterium]
MRLFTAIDLSPEVLDRLERLLSALRPEALIKWSPVDNLHITTKFIGSWEEARLDELNGALASLVPRASFDLEIRDLGWFPNERSPRVLWAGVHGAEPLIALARETEERLEQLGIKKEEREFAPHLTLARIKNPAPLRRLRTKVEEMRPAALGKFPVTGFALYRSDPGSNASIYRKLREYKFESALAAS